MTQPVTLSQRATPAKNRGTMIQPIYVRLNNVQETFGVSDDQVRIWANEGELEIFKKGRMSFVRTADLVSIIEGVKIQPVG